MGSPKALLPLGNRTFLTHLIDVVEASRARPILVVLGHEAGRVAREGGLNARHGVEVLVNPGYRAGMLSSILAGLRRLPQDTDGLLLFLVDHPRVSPSLVNRLIAQFDESRAPVVLPVFRGRRGHPVLFSRSVFSELAQAPPAVGARQVVWNHAAEVVEVPTEEPGVVEDIDTPERYRELLGSDSGAPRLVLASSSPRRIDMLKMLGLEFETAHPAADERPRRGETPLAHVRRLARLKARTVAQSHPKSWVLAADTVVAVDGALFGKPRDDREARRMIRKLSGRWHEVLTAMALICQSRGAEHLAVSHTRVRFRKLSEREIRWYVASGEPADKAGAYAIQGKGGLFVDRVVGSPSNVVGFPLETFARLQERAGISFV
jgi:septum formation protein